MSREPSGPSTVGRTDVTPDRWKAALRNGRGGRGVERVTLDPDHPTQSFDWIDVGVVARDATPKSAMKPGIRLHVAGVSRSDTVSALDAFGADRQLSTVHTWVQKAD